MRYEIASGNFPAAKSIEGLIQKYFFSVILLLLVFPVIARSQVVINEISSTNDSLLLDSDGDSEDWIELYNKGNAPVSLLNYSLIKLENKAITWKFPDIVIKPHSHFTVFASGKDRKDFIDHWEVPVYAANPWRYFSNLPGPPPNWRYASFDDSGWLQGIGGIGYGDGDDSTVIAPTSAVFMRRTFSWNDTSRLALGIVMIDYDDAFVAYINGVEVARSNVGIEGDFPGPAMLAYDEHEASLYTGGGPEFFIIDRTKLLSAMRPGNNVLAIQAHNVDPNSSDLSCIPYLLLGVKDTTVTYFSLPNTALSLHTNFTLSNDAEQRIILKDPQGNVIENLIYEPTQRNHSRGRETDGSSSWCIFSTPTPNDTNAFSQCYTGYAEPPALSLEPGFYQGTQLMLITSPGPGTIRYSRNGNEPTAANPNFVIPFAIDSSEVIRAKVFPPASSGLLPSAVTTGTYFINESISLPVFSLTTPPANLWDWNKGIYVMGPNADSTVPYHNSNFWQGWEKLGHIEYFDKNGKKGFSIDCSFEIQGNYSKAWAQKGFTIHANDDYGTPWVEYPLFPDKPNVRRFKGFNIRNAGSDWNTCHFRDRLIQKTVHKKTDIDVMDGEACVLFLNGEYWGVYELREKQDKYYVQENHGVDAEKIDLLRFDGYVDEGSNQGFIDMFTYIALNNMVDPAKYDSAQRMLDIENFCDYMITETYCVNIDWLGNYTNNIKYWRPNSPAGKWRYMLWDTDVSMALAGGVNNDTVNMLARAINPPTLNPHSYMLNQLLQNQDFRNYFVNRYADLINTIFHPVSFGAQVQAIKTEMQPEMERHFLKWGGLSPLPGLIAQSDDVSSWNTSVNLLLNFINLRPANARNHIQQQFGLVKQVNVTLKVDPPGAGTIRINTIEPDSLPWTGVYFDGVPVTVTAFPNPGYKFQQWTADNASLSQNDKLFLTLNLESDDVLTAQFEALDYNLSAYPNPFSNDVTIEFTLPFDQQAALSLYSLVGIEIVPLVSPQVFSSEGMHRITFDPEKYSLPQGVYFLQLRAGEYVKTIKLVKATD